MRMKYLLNPVTQELQQTRMRGQEEQGSNRGVSPSFFPFFS